MPSEQTLICSKYLQNINCEFEFEIYPLYIQSLFTEYISPCPQWEARPSISKHPTVGGYVTCPIIYDKKASIKKYAPHDRFINGKLYATATKSTDDLVEKSGSCNYKRSKWTTANLKT